ALAIDRSEFLGIVKTARNAVGIENHRRRHHWTGQRTSPGLVAACHRKQAALDGSPFARKGRPDGRLTQGQPRRGGTFTNRAALARPLNGVATHGARSTALGRISRFSGDSVEERCSHARGPAARADKRRPITVNPAPTHTVRRPPAGV